MSDLPVQLLLLEVAQRYGDRVAIRAADTSLTYSELLAQAKWTADLLVANGIAPNSLVALDASRSPAGVATLIGILLANCAYLPIDLAGPAQRTEAILRESGAVCLLSTQHITDQSVHVGPAMRRLVADAEVSATTPAMLANVEERLAYVMYTSGSTGRPKGVEMQHRALTPLVQWQMQTRRTLLSAQREKHLNENRAEPILLQTTPFTFDVSFLEIFSTLCAGGTLILATEEERHDMLKMLESADREQVQCLYLPVSALLLLAEFGLSEQIHPGSLVEVQTGGEQLRITPVLRRWFSGMTHCALINIYGPTEAHVVTTHTLTGSTSAAWPAICPIGASLAHVDVSLFDDDLKVVPAGTTGEIYLGGTCISSGYRHSPELTAEVFIIHPITGQRLYRTGDFGRLLEDGTLRFEGRRDNQVKIRGFRVELDEVEGALLSGPDVSNAVVLAVPDSIGVSTLVALVTATSESLQLDAGAGAAPTLDGAWLNALRLHVANLLPAFMHPARILHVADFPYTASGKIDRRALLEQLAATTGRVEVVAPPLDNRELVAELWKKHLDLEDVGYDEGFFTVGGSSLLLMKIQADLMKIFERRIPVIALMTHPTIQLLAEYLDGLPAETVVTAGVA